MSTFQKLASFSFFALCAIQTAVAASPAPNTTCSSASIWRTITGPREDVTIAGKVLSIPTQLPLYRHVVEGDRNSVWFSFYINHDGSLSLEPQKNEENTRDTLDFDVIDTPKEVSDSVALELLIGHYPKMPASHDGQRDFDIYHNNVTNLYVERSPKDPFFASCSNKASFYDGPWTSICAGYRRPWPGAGLAFYFARNFIAFGPSIDSCITAFLSDLSQIPAEEMDK